MPDPEYAIATEEVQAVLASQFPILTGASIVLLGEGWASRAFLVEGRWVFRFPKRAAVAGKLVSECALLSALAPRLPVAIPRVVFLGEPSGRYPFRWSGYELLPGSPSLSASGVNVQAIGTQLGALVGALHAFPVGQARELGAADASACDRPERVKAEIRAAIAELGQHLPRADAAACDQALQWQPAEHQGEPVLSHRDLHGEHVCLAQDQCRILGVFDWGDAALSDPAADFAAIKWLGQPGFEAMIAAYGRPLDAGFRQRAALIALRFALWDVISGLARNRSEYVASVIAGIPLACAVGR
jgi:aminoglycoside phosphotransferase (APT) family kinase protein